MLFQVVLLCSVKGGWPRHQGTHLALRELSFAPEQSHRLISPQSLMVSTLCWEIGAKAQQNPDSLEHWGPWPPEKMKACELARSHIQLQKTAVPEHGCAPAACCIIYFKELFSTPLQDCWGAPAKWRSSALCNKKSQQAAEWLILNSAAHWE